MTQEEKAKAYDEALERAKRMFSEKEVNFLFPELEESKGERVRKDLINTIKLAYDCGVAITIETRDEYLAWLEKQGQKDSQVKLPTFTFNDVLALQCCMETVKKVQEDKDLYNELLLLHNKVHDAYTITKR